MEITSILKLISLLVAAGFAILGTTVDYKKEGQVTKWGRIAIIGVIVSGLISAVLLGVEETNKVEAKRIAEKADNDKKQELNIQFSNLVEKAEKNINTTTETLNKTDKVARNFEQSVTDQKNLMTQTQDISGGVDKSVEQQGNILSQIRGQLSLQQKTLQKTEGIEQKQGLVARLLFPFGRVHMSYQVKFPLDTPKFQHFLEILEANARSNIKNPAVKIEGMRIFQGLEEKKIERINLSMDSPYFSIIANTEPKEVADLLTRGLLDMNFFKTEEHPEAQKADLSIRLVTWGRLKDLRSETSGLEEAGLSQSVQVAVIFPTWRPDKGIYIDIKTNLIATDNGLDDILKSPLDFPGYTTQILIPCESELMFFAFQTGKNSENKQTFRGPFKPGSKKCTISYTFSGADF